MKYKVIGIDLAKNIFQVCALNESHKMKINITVSRKKILDTLRQMESTIVVMEACYSANQSLGASDRGTGAYR
jgi:transposase